VSLSNEEAHARAREKGVSGPFYWFVKLLAALVFRIVCGFTATGKEKVPKKGPVVIVPNHKSFWDPFFVAIVLRRPVHFMGKAEHFLARGDALALFPEGTRVREEGLGVPKRGAARLAIEAGAPLVPATITGTEKRRWPLPRKVRIAFGDPVSVAGLEATPEDAAQAIGEVWPQITEEYTRWQTRPSTIAAGAAAVGLAAWVYKKRR
jgi:1-acyl-sn-glycerol-3-phosphate acyltransferase